MHSSNDWDSLYPVTSTYMQWNISRNSPIKFFLWVYLCCSCCWFFIDIEYGKNDWHILWLDFYLFLLISFHSFPHKMNIKNSLPMNKILFDKYHILFEWLHPVCNQFSFWHHIQCCLKNTDFFKLYYKIWNILLSFSFFFVTFSTCCCC